MKNVPTGKQKIWFWYVLDEIADTLSVLSYFSNIYRSVASVTKVFTKYTGYNLGYDIHSDIGCVL